MSFTESIAKACFEDTRAFYKGGSKSTNKIYLDGAESDKKIARDQGAYYTKMATESLRGTGVTPLEAGKKLRENSNKGGNCLEMCCVALAFLEDSLPQDQVFICTLQRPADHCFLIVGKRINDHETMHSLFLGDFDEDSYVIDPWANIFCEPADYYYKFRAKMSQWASQNKAVVYAGEAALPSGKGSYVDICTEAEIMVHDPSETLV